MSPIKYFFNQIIVEIAVMGIGPNIVVFRYTHFYKSALSGSIYDIGSSANGTLIGYDVVRKMKKNGGQVVYYYNNEAEILPSFLDGSFIPCVPNKKHMNNGLLKKIEHYNEDGRILKRKKYTYIKDSLSAKSTKGVKTYSFPFTRAFSVKFYDLNSEWWKLESLHSVEYFRNNDSLKVCTSYLYNATNKLPKIISKKNNEEDILTKLTYPTDFHNEILQEMSRRHIIAHPIEVTTIKNGSIINSNLTTYKLQNNLYVLDKIFKTELSSPLSNFTYFNGITKDSHYGQSPEIEYTKYDQYGNIIEIKAKDEMLTSYILSYNNQYPTAEIVNASYVDVEAALGGENVVKAFAKKRNPTLQEIQTFLAPVFTNSNTKNAMITYYTYQPLIGMTSKTEPNGVTTYYEYDGFGRLQYIKDNNGNIIEKYDYHYKP